MKDGKKAVATRVMYDALDLIEGRLKKEKGVFDLARAFTNISKKRNDVALWFVGPDEENIQDDLKSITLDCNCTALTFASITFSGKLIIAGRFEPTCY